MTTDTHPSSVLVPNVLWAQRHDRVYLTIDVFGVKNEKINLTDDSIEFEGTRSEDNAKFAVKLEFFATIDAESSKKSVSERNISFVLIKKAEDEPYWPRLVKETKKLHYITVDFSKWVDEDDEGEDNKMGDFGMGGMGGGMGGMGDFSGFDPSQFNNMNNFDDGEMDGMPENSGSDSESEDGEEKQPVTNN